jgi:hypothetical protein
MIAARLVVVLDRREGSMSAGRDATVVAAMLRPVDPAVSNVYD